MSSDHPLEPEILRSSSLSGSAGISERTHYTKPQPVCGTPKASSPVGAQRSQCEKGAPPGRDPGSGGTNFFFSNPMA